MKRKHIVVLFFLVSLLVASCSKVFTNGKPVTEQRNLGQRFETICIYNNVNVKLVNSDRQYIELTCPENLIEKVTTEVKGDSLIIKNENEYNWLRSYGYSIDMTVYYDSLREITYASIGDLRCLDSIRGFATLSIDTIPVIDTTAIDTLNTTIDSIATSWSHNFVLRIKEGSGDIDLCFNCDVLKTVFSFGTSKVNLRGIAGYTEHYLKSYGTIRAENLNSNIVKVQSQSTNDVYVWARNELVAYLSSTGNVYYKGDPWIVKECTNEGDVIKLE